MEGMEKHPGAVTTDWIQKHLQSEMPHKIVPLEDSLQSDEGFHAVAQHAVDQASNKLWEE